MYSKTMTADYIRQRIDEKCNQLNDRQLRHLIVVNDPHLPFLYLITFNPSRSLHTYG